MNPMKQMFATAHRIACQRCDSWSLERVHDALCGLRDPWLLDVGCADGGFLWRSVCGSAGTTGARLRQHYYGVEGDSDLAQKAQQRGIKVCQYDLNVGLPFKTDRFDIVHCSQVIEHTHNTRHFIKELWRVAKPGARVVVTSENLTSLLNTAAMAMGYTPFSLMRCCGKYFGNPFGLHYGEEVPSGMSVRDPAYSGCTGHNRVLGALQAEEMFKEAGFSSVVVGTVGLVLVPDCVSQIVEPFAKRRGHLLLIDAVK